MRLFVDTANLQDIEAVLKRGFVRGITTNPSLLAKEPKVAFEEHIGRIVGLIKKYQPGTHLSVEVFSRDPQEILRQAKHFKGTFDHPELSIKVHNGWDELAVIRELSRAKISVNCTCNMSVTQAMMAAAAGARYVSLFWGRIKDGGTDERFTEARERMIKNNVVGQDDFSPDVVVRETRKILDSMGVNSEIIVGSVRSVKDIKEAALAGAHIVTVPPKFFSDMISHFKTDEVVDQFLKDFDEWLK
jgi:transaldolase